MSKIKISFITCLLISLTSLSYSQSGWVQQSSGLSSDIQAVYFIDNNTGYAVSGTYTQKVIKTTDGGLNWNQVGNFNLGDNLNDVCFFNSQTGIVVGGDDFGQLPPVILRTSNGGNTWISINTGNPPILYRGISFMGSLVLIVGNYGTILRSSDNGLSWFLQNSPTSIGLRKVQLVTNNIAYVAGNTGIILKTTDGGFSWIIQNSGTQDYFYGVHFINGETGFVAGGEFYGNNTSILKTTNGGGNWNFQINSTTSYRRLSSIYFLNENTGFSTGGTSLSNGGVIIKTTNSGNNWYRLDIPSNFSWLSDVLFINSNTGFAVGGSTNTAVILRTTSSGEGVPNPPNNLSCFHIGNGRVNLQWQDNSYIELGYKLERKTSIDTNWYLKATMAANTINYQDTGIISGITYYYRIYAYNSYGNSAFSNIASINITSVNNINTEILSNFFLSQNYPNPFNPTTKIKFQIPLSRGVSEGRGVLVRLIIYDALGREIVALVDEQLNPGSYEVEWDGSNYPSGVYFYRLTAGDYIETKKMILMK